MDFVHNKLTLLYGLLDGEMSESPAFIIGFIVSLLIIIITSIFLKYVHGSKTTAGRRGAVLLVGLCDSGKTLLFVRLLSGKFRQTQTSITDSTGLYKGRNEGSGGGGGGAWTLVDLPGHASLRPQFVEKFKSTARAIVFVVDSAAFQKEVRDVAEFLYFLLTDGVVHRNAPGLIVACNKQDVAMAKSATLIRQQLEKEMNTLRETRSAAALGSQDGSDGGGVHLGTKDKEFKFSQLPMKVEFLECSARGIKGEEGDADIDSLESSLAEL